MPGRSSRQLPATDERVSTSHCAYFFATFELFVLYRWSRCDRPCSRFRGIVHSRCRVDRELIDWRAQALFIETTKHLERVSPERRKRAGNCAENAVFGGQIGTASVSSSTSAVVGCRKFCSFSEICCILVFRKPLRVSVIRPSVVPYFSTRLPGMPAPRYMKRLHDSKVARDDAPAT